jgi:hypothetical protein
MKRHLIRWATVLAMLLTLSGCIWIGGYGHYHGGGYGYHYDRGYRGGHGGYCR